MNKTSLKITEKLKSKTLKEASDINTVADIPENWAFIQDIAQVDDIKEKYAQVKKTIECDSFYVEVAKDEYLNVYGMIGVVPDINKVVYPIVINGVEYMAEDTDEDYEHRHRFEDKADGVFDYKGYKFEIYKKLNGSYSSYDPEAEKTYSYTGLNNADKSWDKKKYLPSKEKAIKREQKDIDAFIEKNKISENKEIKMKKIFAESYMLEDFDIMSSKEGEGKVSELGGDKYRIAYKNGKISIVGKNIFTDMIDDGYITRVNRKIDEEEVLEPVERNMVNEEVPEEIDEDKKWIQKAIEHKGALTKEFPRLAKDGFSKEELEKIIKTGTDKQKKQAQLALTLKSFKEAVDSIDNVPEEVEETISEASLEKSKYDALVGIIKSLSQDEIESALEIIGGTLADVEKVDILKISGAFERAYNEIMSAKRKLGK